MRRTKIVCTIGPASSKRSIMEKMLTAGMDVARLNFSHGTHETHAANIALLRELARKMGKPLALLQDLSGPKIRLGDFPVPIAIKRGQEVGFCSDYAHCADTLNEIMIPLPVPGLISALKVGSQLLIDDGKLAFRVTRIEGEKNSSSRVAWAKCTVSGEIKSRKGVTAPGVAFETQAITEKDLEDLRFGLAQGVDWVAVSYVRKASDMDPIFALMKEVGIVAPVIAKIEKFEAVKNFESILKRVQGIMVARGDLGVETPFDEVPLVQKSIIRQCNRAGKPVITATQMLESMLQNPRPTRAETTDVANAILDGTDAVMLSGETAAGLFPVEAVRTMARIALTSEGALYKMTNYRERLKPTTNVTEAIARATADIAEQINATAILCATANGGTARAVAQFRPDVPILGVTTSEKTYRQLALTWGVVPALIDQVEDTDSMLRLTCEVAEKRKLVKTGDTVVLTAGVPVNSPGTTNLIEVHKIGQSHFPKPTP